MFPSVFCVFNMKNEFMLPEPSKRFYREIFEGKSPQSITTTVADGIQAVIGNVERILNDLDCLLAAGRIASASFFLATAEEEFAKTFILIDACRLNPMKHEQALRGLSRAFYSHIQKHAYNTVRRSPFDDSMAKAWNFWCMEVKRWWPESSDTEDGIPAMPHDTYFNREMPLYVDWEYDSKKWSRPDNNTNAWRFRNDNLPSDLDILRAEFTELKLAAGSNLLSPDALMSINEVWSGSYVSDKTPTTEVKRLENRLIECLVAEQSASEKDLVRSPLFKWPLYHFTTM